MVVLHYFKLYERQHPVATAEAQQSDFEEGIEKLNVYHYVMKFNVFELFTTKPSLCCLLLRTTDTLRLSIPSFRAETYNALSVFGGLPAVARTYNRPLLPAFRLSLPCRDGWQSVGCRLFWRLLSVR